MPQLLHFLKVDSLTSLATPPVPSQAASDAVVGDAGVDAAGVAAVRAFVNKTDKVRRFLFHSAILSLTLFLPCSNYMVLYSSPPRTSTGALWTCSPAAQAVTHSREVRLMLKSSCSYSPRSTRTTKSYQSVYQV